MKQPEVDMSDMPDTFDSPYTGQQSMGGGVVGIMEVILSDFLKLLQETEAAESAAQKEYDELVQNEAEAKAARDAQMSHYAMQICHLGPLKERCNLSSFSCGKGMMEILRTLSC